jgi:hypothetical protein
MYKHRGIVKPKVDVVVSKSEQDKNSEKGMGGGEGGGGGLKFRPVLLSSFVFCGVVVR